uniref:Discs, largehomolog-associated protein 4a n=1 Tax=Nothobranchius kuhntae TaxID=321403 RepID=A0A1A8K5R8_NOTKU
MNRLPTSLLDQLERHLPLQRDGFSTLQFHRGRVSKQRSESPGRIRHLMHSVQKLFAKSQSLENSAVKGSINSSGGGEERPSRRSKSKDRAKTEGQKQKPRPNTLSLWSSDDALDTDTTKAGTIAVGYRNPLSMMTLARRQSYLKATHQSLSEQQPPPPPRNSLPSLKELSTNRSLDNLDCLVSPLEAPPLHRNIDFSQCSGTLGRGLGTQHVDLHTFLQSSTESAQDTYLDQQDRGSEANSQSGCSNSSDSLCSIRTSSLAKGSQAPKAPVPVSTVAPAAASVPPVPAPRDLPTITTVAVSTNSTSTHSQNDFVTGFTLEQPPTASKRKLSSIGIQVDCVLPVPREEPLLLSTPLKFQSIGVQVENGRPLSRDSSMASRQNTETDPLLQDVTPTENTSNCTNSQIMNTTATNGQGKAIEQQLLKHTSAPPRISSSPPEKLDPALDPSSLPPPDPSLESGNCSSQEDAVHSSTPACLRDGNWFLKLLQAETGRMEGWCQQMEQETKDNKLSEEVLGTIRSAVGSAQLLISQKFEQFRGLCNENLNVNANPRPTAQDLAGFWDLLQLSIEDISMKFDELYQLKAHKWQLPEKTEKKDENKQLPSLPKKQLKSRLLTGKDKSVDSAVDKQRQEARKRLMAAKKAASVRQNSATESADSIEIYVPEAQTRL